MGVGIEIYTANGQLALTTSDLTTKILGSQTTGTSDGSITIPKNVNQKAWVSIADTNAASVSCTLYGRRIPRITITDNGTSAEIAWVFNSSFGFHNSAPKVSITFLYGLSSN